MNLKEIGEELNGLAIFRSVLNDETVDAFVKLCLNPCSSACGRFAQLLYNKTDNFSRYLLEEVLLSENIYSVKIAANEIISPTVKKRTEEELVLLEKASQIESSVVEEAIYEGCPTAQWVTEEIDFTEKFFENVKSVKEQGYGEFAKNNMFILEGKDIVPAIFKDDTSVSDLKGYERQRGEVEDNIKAMMRGKIAANMLLYGDAGTGKSATVKALSNKYADKGLRLIEIKKSQIEEIPYIMGKVSTNPLKFILFLDDLTFEAGDSAFSAMKAVLEGSVAAKATNTCICVTSNRRHLVKETVADREGGDLHRKDTMEELGALTQRFGLSIIYEKPDKNAYLKVIEELGKDHGITEITEQMKKEAEAFAISKGGRSCRIAKQYIESVLRMMD